MFYDMDDVFKTIPSKTVAVLGGKLNLLFNTQLLINLSNDTLATDLINSLFKTNLVEAVAARKAAFTSLDNVPLAPTDLLKNYKGIEEEEVRV